MSKITLTDLANLQNETTAVNAINGNNATLEAAFDNTLSRDGSTPNQMESDLDMNSNRIINLPAPVSDTEPVRKKEYDTIVASMVDGSIPDYSITNTKLATVPAFSLKGNFTDEASVITDIPIDDVADYIAGRISVASSSFADMATFTSAVIPSATQAVTLTGYSANGDLNEPITYTRLTSTPSPVKAWDVLSADGSYLQLRTSVVSPEMFGSKGDGVTDDSVAVQAAMDYGTTFNVPVRLNKLYVCNNSITVTAPDGSLTVYGNGPETGLDFGQSSSKLFKATGSATQLIGLSGNVSANAFQVDFADIPDLEAGDIFALWNPTGGSWSGFRDAYSQGEILRVKVMATNTAYVYGQVIDTYVAANTEVWRINPIQVTARNFMVKEAPGTAHGAGFQIDYASDSVIDSLYGISDPTGSVANFEIRRSFSCSVSNLHPINQSVPGGSNYGLIISNSQEITVTSLTGNSVRHVIAVGGYSPSGGLNIVNRFLKFIGCNLDGYYFTAESGDMHGNCDYCEYIDCTFRNGCAIGGSHLTFTNCEFFSTGYSASGVCVYGSEIRGGTYTFQGCRFNINGDLNANGCIHVVSNYNNFATLQTHVLVEGCTFIGGGSVNGTAVQMQQVQGSNAKGMNACIRNCKFLSTTLTAILYVRNITDSTAVSGQYLIVDDVTYTGSGTPYFLYPDATIASIPTRQMRQSGFIDTTTAANTVTVPSGANFKLKYSKLPSVFAAIAKSDGSTASTFGDKAATPIVYGFTTSTIRPAITSCDSTNFTAGDTIRLSWAAEIGEI